MRIQQIKKSSNLQVLKTKLEELVKTEDGRSRIIQRYGVYLAPDTIVNQLLNCTYALQVNRGNDSLGYGDISFLTNEQMYQLGYLVFPEYAKQGTGYALAKKLLEYALSNTMSIKAECEITNTFSMQLLKRLAKVYKPSQIQMNTDYTPKTQIFIWSP